MNLLRTRPMQIAAVIYAVVALLCTQVPLLNYLGFEFSFVLAVVASLVAGIVTIGRVRASDPGGSATPPDRLRAALQELRRAIVAHVTVLVVPLIVMAGNAFFVKNCSLLEGLGFFVLIPVVSVIFSCCLAFFCAVHYRRAKVGFALWFGVSIMYAVVLGYCTPAIFSYNFFYGFFPGLTYDEVLTIRSTLVVSRVLTLLVGVVLVWLAALLIRYVPLRDAGWKKDIRLLEVLVRPEYRWSTGLWVLSIALIYAFRCEIGLEATHAYVRGVLGDSVRTEHVTVYFRNGSVSNEEIRGIAAEHEFLVQQIMDVFALPRIAPLESFVYPDERTKFRLVGAGATTIAKPWSRQVHVARQSLDATLKHELVHVIAGEFGMPVLRASLSTGLVEGLAMAVEWDWGNRTLHQYSAAMQDADVAPDITELMTLRGFAVRSPSVSYVLAGSFCRYLMDRYGIRKLVLVYRNLDYQQAYGRSLVELVREWKRFLERVPQGPEPTASVDALFRRPPIFGKVCARVIAERIEKARASMSERDYGRARVLYESSWRESGGLEALSGMLAAQFRLRQYTEVAEVIDSLVGVASHPLMYMPLFLLSADSRWARGDTAGARSYCIRLMDADLLGSYTEGARVRILALGDGNAGSAVCRYVCSDAPDSIRLALLDSARSRVPGNSLLDYLSGRLLQRLSRYEEAFGRLERCSLAATDSGLEAARLRALGESLFRLHRYDEARTCFWQSLNFDASPVALNRVDLWLDRCEWRKHHDA